METTYLVRDYTEKSETEESLMYIVYGTNIFEVLNKAKLEGRKIAVFVLGSCIIDWS